jgi:hypothetical protein
MRNSVRISSVGSARRDADVAPGAPSSYVPPVAPGAPSFHVQMLDDDVMEFSSRRLLCDCTATAAKLGVYVDDICFPILTAPFVAARNSLQWRCDQQCAAGHASLTDKVHARTLQLFPAFNKIRSECITHANGHPFREKTPMLKDTTGDEAGDVAEDLGDDDIYSAVTPCDCSPQCEGAGSDTPWGSHGFMCKIAYEHAGTRPKRRKRN